MGCQHYYSRICIGARELLHSGPRSGLPRTAVKILVKKKIRREICTMKLIQHPNVRLYEVMGSKTRIYIVLEFVMGGDLHDIVATGGRLKEDEARTYFQQLINVVDYCNSRGVYHIDLKVQAVFILDSVLDLAK
ncbi:hypothetical protein BS78_K242500 [Paspalum vaginatum]|uniref:Protein kinase domain-containing protein n=1 Tax=Paspalum vaginatum TaxID=158149 RepID=A0A9W7X7N3_9POAL|nr:hypothetical protein BS78_K242500 [Paspalum vaginatum]